MDNKWFSEVDFSFEKSYIFAHCKKNESDFSINLIMRNLDGNDDFVDIRELIAYKNELFDLVEEYLQNKEDYDGYVLAIDDKSLLPSLMKEEEASEQYHIFQLSQLLRYDDNNEIEVDGDAIDEVAQQFLFVR